MYFAKLNEKMSTRDKSVLKKAIMEGDDQPLAFILKTFWGTEWLNELISEKTGTLYREEDIPVLARQLILLEHHFSDWSSFETFLILTKTEKNDAALFERAADAVISGNADELLLMLEAHPGLAEWRSERTHHATLLHYTGANGVEDFRQKTPTNITEIVRILVRAGADVNALADSYGGSTTLGLAATSVHPFNAGVQNQLIDILLEHGADMSPAGLSTNLVVSCLRNGRGPAALHLACRGAPLDLEGAAGTGRLEEVKRCFNTDGSLKEGTEPLLRDLGFIWACAWNHREVVDFILENGFDISTQAEGMTGLHWAVIEGQLDMTTYLIEKGAPLEIQNCYGGTVLGQALWAAYNHPSPQHPSIIELLLQSGARVEPGWEKYIEEILKRAEK